MPIIFHVALDSQGYERTNAGLEKDNTMKKTSMKSATEEETDAYFKQLIDEHIKPNRDALAKIWKTGEIAVVVADPPTDFVESLKLEGWKGESVFPITRE